MRVTEIFMTPQLAAQMLAKNTGNREIRQATVKSYAADMQAGQWRTTHQAIAVDETGRLVDGQHRLNAVIAANWSGTMLLATYDSTEETMQLPVDRGLRRSLYDVLVRPRQHVEIVTRLLKHTIKTSGAATPHEVLSVLNDHEARIERVLSLCASRKRLIGSACALAGVLLTSYADRTEEEQEESLRQYRLFFEQEYEQMWPHVRGFNAWLVTGGGAKITAQQNSAANDLFTRIYLAFDVNRKHLKVSRVGNGDEVRKEIVARANSLFFKARK